MSKKRIALIFTATIKKDSFFGFLLPSLGLERLGAAIEDISIVELFDVRFEKNLMKELKRFKPDIIALNIKTTVYSHKSYVLATLIKQEFPQIIIIGGGLHATTIPEESMKYCDFLIRGDGEDALRQFVLGEELEKIPGLVYRINEKIHFNKMVPAPENMDYLRPPARHLRKKNYKYSAAGLIKMDLLETSRGCTHACSFCSSGSVYPCKYRYHSPEYLIEEIQKLSDDDVKYCMLTDDHFGGDLTRVEKICDLIIERNIKIAFFTFIRPFEGEMEIKRKMVEAGFVLMSYGAESPNPEQLKRYGKGFSSSTELISRVNREWLEAGACYIGNSYVFGDVDDSKEVLSNIGKFARKLDSTYIEPLYSQPYPGTVYRKELKDRDLLIDRGWDYFTEGRLLVKHPEIDEEEMSWLRAKMWIDFFSPRKIVGVFRVPLYFRNVLNISLRTVLKYMKACDYSVFGCILEEKFYSHHHEKMIDTYFHETILDFETKEYDVTENFDEFTNMIGLKRVKKFFWNRDINIYLWDKKEILAFLNLKIREGKIIIGRVYPKNRIKEYRSCKISTFNFNVNFKDLKKILLTKNEVKKLSIFIKILVKNLWKF